MIDLSLFWIIWIETPQLKDRGKKSKNVDFRLEENIPSFPKLHFFQILAHCELVDSTRKLGINQFFPKKNYETFNVGT